MSTTSQPWPSRRQQMANSQKQQDDPIAQDDLIGKKRAGQRIDRQEQSSKDKKREEQRHHRHSHDDGDDDYDDDDDKKENPMLKGFAKHLSFLVSKFGSKILNKEGGIDWDQADRYGNSFSCKNVCLMRVVTKRCLSWLTTPVLSPSYISPNATEGGGCGVSVSEYSCAHGAQINFPF